MCSPHCQLLRLFPDWLAQALLLLA